MPLHTNRPVTQTVTATAYVIPIFIPPLIPPLSGAFYHPLVPNKRSPSIDHDNHEICPDSLESKKSEYFRKSYGSNRTVSSHRWKFQELNQFKSLRARACIARLNTLPCGSRGPCKALRLSLSTSALLLRPTLFNKSSPTHPQSFICPPALLNPTTQRIPPKP
eukprot:761570-Hanusia_phi.AAC.1